MVHQKVKTKAEKNEKTECWGMGPRAMSNQQQGTSTPVDKHEVSTKLINETLLTAQVEATATITKVNIPSPNATYQRTAIIDSGTTSSCGLPNNPFIITEWVSTKISPMPLGQIVATIMRQQHTLQNQHG